jgi:plastocyanin
MNAGPTILRPGIFLGALLLVLRAHPAAAGELHVTVVDNDGRPVPDVAVFATQRDVARPLENPRPAVMDQKDERFVPHILLVQKGAAVEFPNSDVIAHHVYSFSRPNDFELPLYKGTPPDPVRFVHDGIVTLGCNIHDSMLGYIVVVDTDVFAMTDGNGAVTLDVDDNASGWRVHAWSPRFRDSREPLVTDVGNGDPLVATFRLQKGLRPAHGDESGSLLWNDY